MQFLSWEEWGARKKEQKLHEEFDPQLKQAKRDGDEERYDEILHEFFYNLDDLWDPIRSSRTERKIAEARRLGLVVPRKPSVPPTAADLERVRVEKIWEISMTTGLVYLTDKGIYDLKIQIRKEKKELREEWTWWVSITFGFMGLLIGLVSKSC